MRASEFVGGLSVVGVVALIGLALFDDSDPDTLTVPPAPTILTPIETTPATATDTTEAAPDDTTASSEVTESSESTADSGPSTSASPGTTTAATTAAPPTTESAAETAPPTAAPTIAPADRATIRSKVINAGGPAGSAAFVTDALRAEGFEPEGPDDGAVLVDQTLLLFAPGQEAAAATISPFVEVAPERIIEAPADDPNWGEFGAELDVLVVLGPAP